jgi:GT2 family glycosyltransferase
LGRETSPAPAYAFKVTYSDGKLCEMNRPGENVLAHNPIVSLCRGFHIDEKSRECLVDFASFVGLLVSRRTVEQVGLVSKSFFIYSDDTYYTLSISSQVGKIRYSPGFVIVHDCKRSSRRLLNHDPVRLERDVINKVVLIREYSKFQIFYTCLYVARLLVRNPKLSIQITRSACKGMCANLQLYRNERLSCCPVDSKCGSPS